MKRVIQMVFVAIMVSISAQAQKIQVADADGNAIPLVSVLTEDGVLIGSTDISGTLTDVKGTAKVALFLYPKISFLLFSNSLRHSYLF